jgi:hypothetical protein
MFDIGMNLYEQYRLQTQIRVRSTASHEAASHDIAHILYLAQLRKTQV